jgi:hypothetical protein
LEEKNKLEKYLLPELKKERFVKLGVSLAYWILEKRKIGA